VKMGTDGSTAMRLRLIWLIASLIVFGVVASRVPRQLPPKSLTDTDWQPVKRFAFIMLCLLVGFQAISAFWPEAQAFETARVTERKMSSHPAGNDSPLSREPMAFVQRWPLRWAGCTGELVVGWPDGEPVRLHAPELSLAVDGWRVAHRRLVPHSNGQAVSLTLTRGKQIRSAVYWFQSSDRAFTDYLRARHILWSGWNLNRRDVRLVIAWSDEAQPDGLVQYAESQEWFRRLVAGNPAPQSGGTSYASP